MVAKKYRPLFAKKLRQGLRKAGWTIDEVCEDWGITKGTYYYWIKHNPKFAEAAEIGDVHFSAWWSRKYRKVADGEEKGNAGLLVFGAKNVMGWTDKTESHTTHQEEKIRTLNINILPSYNDVELIEHQAEQDNNNNDEEE